MRCSWKNRRCHYFLGKIATSILEVRGDGEVRRTMGGYSDDYLVQRTQEEKSLPKKESAPRERHAAERPQKLRFSFKEQREYDTIDADITALEEKTERWVYLNDLTERIAAQDRTT